MKCHLNTHWLREKCFIRLIKKYNFILSFERALPNRRRYNNSELALLERKLKLYFYDYYIMYYYYNSYRGKIGKRTNNKSNRLYNKSLLRKELNFIDDIVYDKKRTFY